MLASEQFPMFRLGTLLARQLSSPLATRIKEYAKGHPGLGRAACVRGGRAAAAVELRVRLWAVRAPHPTASQAHAVSDAHALEAGADLIGEMLVFALGAAILTYEFSRQALKQEEKASAEVSRREAMRLQLEELRAQLAVHQRDMERLAAALRTLAARRPHPAD